MSGSGGVEMEVCPCNGVGVRQVGQVGQLAGPADRGQSGASCWINEMIACRKQEAGSKRFLPHYLKENHPECVIFL